MKKYDEYIAFLLIGDEFDVSKKLRNLSKQWGMDDLYTTCIYIATKFQEYDKDKNYKPQYESLVWFLREYEKQINEYIDDGTEFEL